MRASQFLSRQTHLVCDFFWGRPNRLSQWHCDRDRARRIENFLAEESPPPLPERTAPLRNTAAAA